MSKWKDIYLHLKGKGVDVYSIGQKEGTCKSAYVVLTENGTFKFAGTRKQGYSLVDVIVYYPMPYYSKVNEYVEQIKGYMKELDFVRFTGTETPIIVDDDFGAYTTSLEYQNLKQLDN